MSKPKVKGSPKYSMKVVAHRPAYVWGRRALAFIGSMTLAATGYLYGYKAGGVDLEQTRAKLSSITKQAGDAESAVSMLEQRVSKFDITAEINTQVINQLRSELVELQKSNEELVASNDFFKNLLQPGSNRLALRFDGLKMGFDGESYRYSVNLRQLAVDHKLLKGEALVEVLGYQGQEFVTLTADLLGDSDSKGLRFRYYQAIEGTLTLPEGFRPTELRVKADVGKASEELIEPWPHNAVAGLDQ